MPQVMAPPQKASPFPREAGSGSASPHDSLEDEKRRMQWLVLWMVFTQGVSSVAQSISPFLFVKWLEYMLPRSEAGYWSLDQSAFAYAVALVLANVLYLGVGIVMNDLFYTSHLTIENVALLYLWNAIDGTDALGALSAKLEAIWMHANRFQQSVRRVTENVVTIILCCIFLFFASAKVGAILFVCLVVINIGLLGPYGKMLSILDAASITCKGKVNTQLQDRVRFDRTVKMSGRADLELERIRRVLVARNVASMSVIRSFRMWCLAVVSALLRQIIVAVGGPFLMLWIYRDSSLDFTAVWLVSIYGQIVTVHCEAAPQNIASMLSSYAALIDAALG